MIDITKFDGHTAGPWFIANSGKYKVGAIFLIALGIGVALLFGWLWPIAKACVHGVTA